MYEQDYNHDKTVFLNGDDGVDIKKIVPISPLDNILKLTNYNNITVSFYEFLDGTKLTDENKKDFYKKIKFNIINKLYPSIDHLIIVMKINNINFIYISLDNSLRANTNNHPLYLRIDYICEVLLKIMKSLSYNCIVFFSESCRPSFAGSINNKKNLMSWFKIRQFITNKCNLEFLIEKRNYDDYLNMSFGISVFFHKNIQNYIDCYYVQNILSKRDGFGSATIGVKLNTGEIIWGIHFPIDFKNLESDNLGYKAMINLQNLMQNYKGSICAFGDFNTIPGYINNVINSAIFPQFEFFVKNELTFFGSYYDTIFYKEKEMYSLL